MEQKDQHTKIEEYLQNEMNTKDKAAFEAAMKGDPSLAKEFQFHKELHRELENRPKQILRTNLHHLGDEYLDIIPNPKSKPFNGRWQNYIPGIVVFFLGVAAAWFLVLRGNLSSEQQTLPPADTATTELPTIDSQQKKEEATLNELNTANPKKEESPQTETPKKKESEKKPSVNSNSNQDNNEKPKRPIAANFEVNPALEKYLSSGGSLVRGGDYELKLEQNAVTNLSAKDGPLLIKYSGILSSESGEEPGNFKFRLFSNKPTGFKQDKPVAEWDLVFTPQDGAFTFKITETLRTASGLYYFIIEDWDSGEKYYVGKILFSDE